MKYPFYGSRQTARQLHREGIFVGRHRMRRQTRLMGLDAGTVINFVRGAGFVDQTMNLSPKRTANCVFASTHSRGGRFHSLAA